MGGAAAWRHYLPSPKPFELDLHIEVGHRMLCALFGAMCVHCAEWLDLVVRVDGWGMSIPSSQYFPASPLDGGLG